MKENSFFRKKNFVPKPEPDYIDLENICEEDVFWSSIEGLFFWSLVLFHGISSRSLTVSLVSVFCIIAFLYILLTDRCG